MSEQIKGIHVEVMDKHIDQRGWLLELWRADEGFAEMAYVSMTLPGIGRGPHEHVKQTDVFVFPGIGEFKLMLWDARKDSPTCGNSMTVCTDENACIRVTVPPGVVHGYKNVSDHSNGLVFNFPDRLFAGVGKKDPVDEIRHEDKEGSPYELR